MYRFGAHGFGLAILLIILGLGLVLACLKGIRSREGMYDEESSKLMLWSQVLGILLGLGLAVGGFNILRALSIHW